MLREIGKIDEAIYYFKAGIIVDPKMPSLYNGLGWIYYKMNKFDMAIEMFEKLKELSPDNKSCFYLLGYLYDEKLEFLTAFHNYQEAILLDPDNCKMYYNTALILHKSDIFTPSRTAWYSAYPYYTKSAELGCEQSHKYLNDNGFYIDGKYLSQNFIQGRDDKSLDSSNYFFNIGAEEYDNNNFERAIKFFEFAINAYSQPDYYFTLGTLHLEQKNYAAAINILKNAIYLFPDDYEMKQQLGVAYLGNDNYDNAIRIYKCLTILNPHSSDDLFNLAQSYHRFGSWSKAWPIYKLSAEKGSQKAIKYIDSVEKLK